MSDSKQHYLDRYAKKEFRSEYKEYLENPYGECPYADIDAVRTMDEKFYNDMTDFLTISIGDSKYEFERPEKSKYPFAIKFRDMDVPADHIYLTSDQFGFSAPYGGVGKDNKCKKSSSWNGRKNYPYARYLSVNCDDDKGAGNSNEAEFVASCIYETRTIGGSFLWPKVEIGGQYKSSYNRQRGEQNYTEDRVDITLYEIKCFYDVYSKLEENNYENFKANFKDYKGIILFNSQGEGERKAIYRWLSIFETFERYVEKLKFDDFVIKKMGEYLIRDMASERALSPLDITKIKKIQNMDSSELKILLENVKECTESRTEKIQKLVIERRGMQ